MFGRRARSYTSSEDKVLKRRRDGRGLGPFTGGQLTAIVITFAVLLLFPLGAWAVTGNNVFVTDATSGTRAKVDAKNNLNTAIHDAGTGTAAKVNGLGQLSAAVTGSVSANVVYPTSAIFQGGPIEPDTCSTAPCAILAKPPSGKALVITSIHVETFRNSTPGQTEFFRLFISSDATCSLSAPTDVEYVTPAGLVSTVLPYEPGIGIPAGKALCAKTSDVANLNADISAWGYTVAPAAVPATAPAGPRSQLGQRLP
jgi:hypothetical protein